MSLDPPPQASPPIGSVDELVQWMRVGERPREQHRVGVEQEKLGVLDNGDPLPLTGPRSVAVVLEGLAKCTGGQLLVEDGVPIGVQLENASISLEPGGQLELSGAPARNLADAAAELHRHVADVDAISAPLGISWLAIGYRPWGPRSSVPWLPRGRYKLMRRALPGGLAHDMMQMTASIQSSFDFESEDDAGAKASVATAVSPVVAALFSNSPLTDGRPNGHRSFRYQVWRDTDPSRCGLLRFMYEPGFTFRKYVEWALDAPLLFIRRGDGYRDAGGRTLRDVMRDGFEGEPASMQDWVDLLSSLFPEVRLKRVLELRGADAVDTRTTLSQPALWTGVLYDDDAREEARRLIDVPFDELLVFQEAVAREGLRARLGDATALELAVELIRIADDGLRRRFQEGLSPDERPFLDPLREIVTSGRCGADRILDVHERTNGDRAALIELLRY